MTFARLLICLIGVLFAHTGPAFAACANPAGTAGEMIYNTDFHVTQYCDGTTWIAMLRKGKPLANIETLANGLVGHWKLDESSGTTVVDFAKGNNGTLTNGPVLQPTGGIVSGAVELTATTDWINVGDPADGSLDFGTGPFTVATWVKTPGYVSHTSSRNSLIKKQNIDSSPNVGYQLSYNTTNQPSFALGDNVGASTSVTATTAIDDDQWHHVAGVRESGGVLRIYIDGVEEGTGSFFGNVSSSQIFSIGGDSTLQRSPDGLMDDVRIYNRALSAVEIQSLYNMGVSDGLVAGFHLDETSGTTAVNFVSSGLNGTMLGGLDASNDSVTGQINAALDFDGTNDSVSISNFDPLPQGTVTFWMKPNVVSPLQRQRLFGGHDAYEIILEDTVGNQLFAAGSSVLSGINVLKPGTWYHLAATYDLGTNAMELYLDGELENSGSLADDDPGGPFTLYLGRSATAQYFNGVLDDIRIYSRVLTQAEIQKVMAVSADCAEPFGKESEITYNQHSHLIQFCNGTVWVAMGQSSTATPPAIGPQTNLIAYWPMDIDSGGFTPDQIGTNDLGISDLAVILSSGGKLAGVADIPFGDINRLFTTDASAVPSKGPLSISMWVNMRRHYWHTHYANKSLGGFADNWILTTNGTGNDRGHLRFLAVYTGTDLDVQTVDGLYVNGDWTHLVATWDGTDSAAGVRLYVNGAEPSYVTQTDPTGSHIATTGRELGFGGASNGQRFDGKIDEVRLFDDVLTPAEVLELYESKGICSNPSGVEGELFFNDAFDVMQYCNGTAWVGIGK